MKCDETVHKNEGIRMSEQDGPFIFEDRYKLESYENSIKLRPILRSPQT